MSHPTPAEASDRAVPLSRADFVARLGAALEAGAGFAAGKLGPSPLHWMAWPLAKASARSRLGLRLFEREVRRHAEKNSGVYPATPEFLEAWNERYAADVAALDAVGLFLKGDALERMVVEGYGIANRMHYQDQEPDRSLPDRPERCWLPLLRGRRVLLVCPFASLLAERAREDVFEGVWARTGKRWFHPRSVEALDTPYGFAAETQARYPTAFDLLDAVRSELDRREFDVALVATAGLAIPLCAHVKRRGRVAVDLGGHLQVLFGVIGQRWRRQRVWRESYFTDAWIDMPARLRPVETGVCDDGAYW